MNNIVKHTNIPALSPVARDIYSASKKPMIKSFDDINFVVNSIHVSVNKVIADKGVRMEIDDINYLTISEIPDTNEITNEKENNNIHFFIEKLAYVKSLKDDCGHKIEELCCHDYVNDVIDISHERSQHITYCTICETVKN